MTKKKPNYTLLNHTADLGIKICGNNLSDLFEQAGNALIHVMFGNAHQGKTRSMKISVLGDDLADLMVRWLGEILYLFEGDELVVTSITIDSLNSSQLEATLETVSYEPEIHEILNEIKAVTYHQIQVTNRGDIWEARVIFDL
jgi:SHS2 domain-containing protein